VREMRNAETILGIIRHCDAGRNEWLESRMMRNVSCPVVCPEKADVLSGSQSRRGKSRNPVAWMAGRRETE
jgi:hypothetical protein